MATIPQGFTAIAPGLLTGRRVRLHPWTEADHAPFAALNADPVAMEFFPAPLTRAQSDALTVRINKAITQRGWGLWAAERLPADGRPALFMGFIGLGIPAADLPFQPCVEIGWRLARPFWGQGLATEGARLALRVGFEALALDDIVSFTTLRNTRSRAVMERLGMQESPAERFDHPSLPAGNPQRPHCLYRLPRARWSAAPQ
ncbi:GNAT family N-acetyltransferase [Caenimonas terrae]|uniref:GNAT family N-acetyltransferase n=1 Tax=Caenimonas terrae TaxID=696074 RepID=A0ABW0NK85_9BURK